MKTTEFNEVLTLTLSRAGNLLGSLGFDLLSKLVRALRFFIRIKLLRKLELGLHRVSRDLNAKAMQLPPVTHHELEYLETLIAVPDDPSILLTGTVYLPKHRTGKVPAVLIRTPYGRNSPLLGARFASVFAERGYACLMQDTRGRFGSGGDFFPIVHEVNDGGTTVEWLRNQDWCSGKVGTFGVSYLGMTSYASTCKQRVDACAPVMASSRMYPVLFHGGATFSHDLIVRWLWLVMNLMHDRNPITALWKVLTPEYQLRSALHPAGEVPIQHRDVDVVGKPLHFFREVYNAKTLEHDFWVEKDKLCDLSNAENRPPLTIVAGWYDFFSKQSFQDFLVASKSSPNVPLKFICGSWCHFDLLEYSPLGFNVALELFDVELKSNDTKSSEPSLHELNLHVINSETEDNARGTWLKFHSWPPPNVQERKLLLTGSGELATVNEGLEFTANHYSPQDPTPHVGGLSFNWANSGKMSQNELESRSDVSTFTSSPVMQDLLVVGNVTVTLYVSSDNEHTDLFVKLCDVDAKDKSLNVLEKIVRLTPDTFKLANDKGVCQVEVDMGPCAAMFQRGHSVRLQVSGGAHPAYLRHPGIEDHNSMELQSAQRKIHHTVALPSQLVLPVLQG
ncbi:hypothetical protein BASA81_003864 [Batrachochytrium salamandrivorans]|nr:hypothetical protein BASA81_003864 [Batrachochytrium salamandrivorans]